MKIIAIANQKGGVAKTSTAINLSAALAEKKYDILLIDIDPQANATVGSGVDKETVKYTSANLLLNENIDSCIIKTKFGYDVVAGNQDIIAAEISLIDKENGAFGLRQALSKSIFSHYDFILIDCPPSLSMLTLNALTATHGVLIPMQCEYYAMEGIADLLQTIENVRVSTNSNLSLYGILRTMYDPRTSLSKDVSDQLIVHFGGQVFNTIIPRNIRIAEAPSHSMPVLEYDAKSTGSLAYKALADEIERREILK